MKVFTCKSTGVILGYYAVVAAHDHQQALTLVNERMEALGLRPAKADELQEFETNVPNVETLFDGDY
jgi:hypothetical protein